MMTKGLIVSSKWHMTAVVGLFFLTVTEALGGFQSHLSQQRGLSHVLTTQRHDAFKTVYAYPMPQQLGKGKTRDYSSSYSQLEAVPVAATSIVSSSLEGVGRLLFPSSNVSKILRAAAFFTTGALAAFPRVRQRIFWPGLTYPSKNGNDGIDKTDAELLPGTLGCPFIGVPFMIGNEPSFGAGSFYRTQAKKLGAALGKVPKVWKYYFMGTPLAVISGGESFQKVMSMEFNGSLTSSAGVEMMEGGLISTESISFESDKKRHTYLRRLVGQAMTPAEVSRSAPTLQAAAEEQVSKMMTAKGINEQIKFQQFCTDYTLDVARRQILGLELPEEEIPYFEKQVAIWIKATMSIRTLLRIAIKSSPGYKAKLYIVSKIEQRIDELLKKGPDNKSTLSAMVFASDKEGGTGKKLSREEIIENALMLIFAGSETSANTLTNAMLFLGLHPSAWDKLVKEQETIIAREGSTTMTLANLDATNAPYLDAVIKESLRIRAVSGGLPRKVIKDIDVDGDGKTIIPKGWLIDPSIIMTHEEDPATKLPEAMHMDAIQGFRPERWLEDDDTYETPSGQWFVPFGHGPRYCLGKNLAMLEMKIFLATMARKIDFPKLAMLPENYDYSRDKKSPGDPNYFSVEWSTDRAVIANAKDGVIADVMIR